MNATAVLSHPHGGMVLPASTPYDMAVLWEHVVACAKRHGRVRMRLNGHEWVVGAADSSERRCMRCRSPLTSTDFEDETHAHYCAGCARRASVRRPRFWPLKVAR